MGIKIYMQIIFIFLFFIMHASQFEKKDSNQSICITFNNKEHIKTKFEEYDECDNDSVNSQDNNQNELLNLLEREIKNNIENLQKERKK